MCSTQERLNRRREVNWRIRASLRSPSVCSLVGLMVSDKFHVSRTRLVAELCSVLHLAANWCTEFGDAETFFKYTTTQQILTRNEMISEPLTVLNILPYISVCAAVLMFRHLYGHSTTEWVFTAPPQI